MPSTLGLPFNMPRMTKSLHVLMNALNVAVEAPFRAKLGPPFDGCNPKTWIIPSWTKPLDGNCLEYELIGSNPPSLLQVISNPELKQSLLDKKRPHLTQRRILSIWTLWHYLEHHEKQTFMNYGHAWSIKKTSTSSPTWTKKKLSSSKMAPPFFFGCSHPWGSKPFLGNLLVSKESYCCLVDHGDQDQSPTPPSEQQETPENPMVSRTIGSSRKQQSGETTPLTQYRSGRVSPDKSRNISAKLKKTTIEKS